MFHPPPSTFTVRLQTYTLEMPYDHYRIAMRYIWLDWHHLSILKPTNVQTAQ